MVMTMRGRTAGIIGVGFLTGFMALGATAWGCTVQAGIDPLLVQSGRPGTKLAVTGEAIAPGPVELRWNGIRGPVVATAIAGGGSHSTEFAAEVTVPEAAPGVYYLVLASGDAGVGRAAFEVTAVPPATSTAQGGGFSAADVWSTTSSSATTDGASPALALGTGMLAVGLVALFTGATVGAVRRSRVPVRQRGE